MKRLCLIGVSLFLLFALLGSHVSAQNMTFRDRANFEAFCPSPVLLENFDGFRNWQKVDQLFDGLITFNEPYPTIFWGRWWMYGTQGDFSGGAIIPEPRFRGASLVLNFSSPVFGVGGNAFDDFDGSPFVNVITLTMTTALGTAFSISEDFPKVGDTGFLGATSSEGIVKAEFSIDNTNGNLEVDLLTVAPLAEVPIDIKPGSYPNSINLKSKGVVPVAVLTTEDFDASTVDPETVVFAGAEPVRSTMEDVDGDDDQDMLFHFNTQDLNLTEDSTEATLNGETNDGTPIQGTDTVSIVPKGKAKGQAKPATPLAKLSTWGQIKSLLR